MDTPLLGTMEHSALRGRAYRAFAQLFLDGRCQESLFEVVPALGPAVRSMQSSDGLRAQLDDLWLQMSPFAGVFLSEGSSPGGAIASEFSFAMRQAGYAPDDSSVSADHISVSLGYLSWLSHQELAAWANGRVELAARWMGRARAFIETQLLRWLPPFVLGVETHDPGRLGLAARALIRLLTEHLGRDPEPIPLPVEARPISGIDGRGLARHLATPVQVGAMLTSTWARKVAKQTGVWIPRLQRSDAFDELLEAGVARDAGRSLYAQLDQHLRETAEALEELPCGAPWADRMYRTAHAVRSSAAGAPARV